MSSWKDDYTRSRAIPVDTYEIDDIIGRKDGADPAAEVGTCSGVANIIQTIFTAVASGTNNIIVHDEDTELKRMVQVSEWVDGTEALSDTSLDFDVVDEGNYIQEDSVSGTTFIGGTVTLKGDFSSTWEITEESVTPVGHDSGETQVMGVDNDIMVISFSYTDVSASNSGNAEVYVKIAGSWVNQHTIESPTFEADGYFGSAVDAYDGLFVITADEGTKGKIHTYSRSGNSLVHEDTIDLATAGVTGGGVGFDYIGIISSTKFLYACENQGQNGAICEFTYSGGSWSLTQEIIDSPYFGSAFALDRVNGRFVAADRGTYKFQVWEYNGTNWVWKWTSDSIRTLDADADCQQSKLTIVEDTFVVGDWLSDVGSDLSSGHVFVFVKGGGDTWSIEQKIPNPNSNAYDYFGKRLGLLPTDDNQLFITAPGWDLPYNYFGTTYRVDRSGILWTIREQMTPNFLATDVRVGQSDLVFDTATSTWYAVSRYGRIFEITQPVSYPSVSYYVTTSDTNHINVSSLSIIDSVSITDSAPTNTSLGSLVSFDGRTTWNYWAGDSFELHAGLTTTSGWSTTSGIEAGLTNYTVSGTSYLDFAFLLETTDSGITPYVDQVTLTYTEEDYYEQLGTDDYNIDFISSERTRVTKLTSGTDTEIKVNILLGE